MRKFSAGLLVHRQGRDGLEVLLVHPGGPFWTRKDAGSWSIPKGEYLDGEAPAEAALREFAEETGWHPPVGPLVPLGSAVQPSRKVVTAFAAAGDYDPATLRSNLVEIAWPPRSGRRMTVPEVDRAGWFGVALAADKILPGQLTFLERLGSLLAVGR